MEFLESALPALDEAEWAPRARAIANSSDVVSVVTHLWRLLFGFFGKPWFSIRVICGIRSLPKDFSLFSNFDPKNPEKDGEGRRCRTS
jgi:hypothetical protein